MSSYQESMKWRDGRYGAYAAGFVIQKSIEDGNPADTKIGLCLLPENPQECKGALTLGCKNWLLDQLLRLHEAGYLDLEPGQLKAAGEQRQEFSTGPCGDIPENVKQELEARVEKLIENGHEEPRTIGEALELGHHVYEKMIQEDPEEWGRLESPKW